MHKFFSLILLYAVITLVILSLPLPAQASIDKAPEDHREYLSFTMENSMEVIVVSDKHAKNSSVALSVGAGSYQDPRLQQGLAHYLEHMIFQGSENFPTPYGFIDLIDNNAGHYHATTRGLDTSFFFDISPIKFELLLKQFSDAIKVPVFGQKGKDIELATVNRQWKGFYKNDTFIKLRVSANTSNPKHPISMFPWGNRETLSNKPESLLHEELIKFHQRYYSSNLMTLVLIGNQNISELKTLAEHYFSSVINRQTPRPVVTESSFTEAELGKHIYVKSKKALKGLYIQFPLYTPKDKWANRTNEYIVEMLNNREPKSLGAQLVSRNWIKDFPQISIHDSPSPNFGYSVTLEFDLTQKKHKDNVIAQTFNYLEFIKKADVNCDYTARLRSKLHKRASKLSTYQPYEFAQYIAINMQHVTVQHVLNRDSYFSELDIQEIRQTLETMNLNNVRLWHIDKRSGRTPIKLKFAGSSYDFKEITLEDRQKWNQPSLGFKLHNK